MILKDKGFFVVLVAAAVYVGALNAQLWKARKDRDQAADSLINARAALDTVRQVEKGLWEILALQQASVEPLAPAKGRAGAATAEARVDTVWRDTTHVVVATVAGDSAFTTDSASLGPVTSRATVLIAAGRARWDWSSRMDGFALTVGLSCQPGPAGRRAPVADIKGPEWFKPSSIAVSVVPAICNGYRPPSVASTGKRLLIGAALAIAVERLILPLVLRH